MQHMYGRCGVAFCNSNLYMQCNTEMAVFSWIPVKIPLKQGQFSANLKINKMLMLTYLKIYIRIYHKI